MDYTSLVLLVQSTPGLSMAEKYRDVVGQALYMTMPTGCLDILIMNTPSTLRQLETEVSELYEVCRVQLAQQNRPEVTVTVLIDGRDIELTRPHKWEAVTAGAPELGLTVELRRLVPPEVPHILGLPVVLLTMDDERSQSVTDLSSSLADSQLSNGSSAASRQARDSSTDHEPLLLSNISHDVVAVGGTFDHLHDGHRILLTIAGYLAREKLIVGITGPEMLKNKKYAAAMQSYDERKQSVEKFLNYVYPTLLVDPSMISDIYGPTASIEDIQALVLSQETRKGGAAVNEFRQSKNWPPLEVYEIDVIGGPDGNETNNWQDKMSSTELRRRELENKSSRTGSNI